MQSDLRETQFRFTHFLRQPDSASPPEDVPLRRMQAYRELVANNVESAITSCFPVLSELVGENSWAELVNRFFSEYRCQSPIYRDIPAQFLSWLETGATERFRREHPYGLELAHYEWMELALDIDPTEIPVSGVDREGDPVDGIPVLNPLARSLEYRYPVHAIGTGFRPTEPNPEPTRLVMVRRRDHEIGFLEVNPLVARLIDLLRDHSGRTGRALLETIAGEFPGVSAEVVLEGGAAALRNLTDREIVLGTRC